MHTLMIAASTLAALGVSGSGIIVILHRLDVIERNQRRHLAVSARGVSALEHLGPEDSGPQRAYIPTR